ncbi:MAG: hypothetical protein WCJ87_06105 [Burkholderiales bacterium]
MHAAHFDELVVRMPAWHHRHPLLFCIAAQMASRVRRAASPRFWRWPWVATASLALLTCAAMASADVPNATAPGSPTAAASGPPAMLSPTASPAHVRPDIRPLLSDEDRLAAQQEGKLMRSADPPAEAARARSIQPVTAASAKTASIAAVSVDGFAAYALVSDVTRTRIASELRQQLMSSTATVGDLPGTPRAELMQVATSWRAVIWPFATESEANKARRTLAERGIRTELVKF